MANITERIIDFNHGRLKNMLKLKYAAMRENLFRFYRGTCHIFYEDLYNANLNIKSPLTWLCGDLHIENFGSFKSDNRQVYFDLNDFDESIIAPAHLELLRMATSIYVAFESLQIDERKAEKMVALYLKSYSNHLKTGKATYIEPNTAEGIVAEFLKAVNKKKQAEILKKRTIKKKNKLQIITDETKHFKLDKYLRKELCQHVKAWLSTDDYSPYNYKITDAVFRFAGTSSLGLKRYAFLLRSLNKTGEKHIMLDMKQSASCSLSGFVHSSQPVWNSDAERIIEVQKRMQNRAPALLSKTVFKGEPYVVQEMQPEKDSINFKLLKNRYRDMYRVVDDMAMLTASAQIRSCGRDGSAIADELIEFGKREDWQKEVQDYARSYALQVKHDYVVFLNESKT
jgi:uncharacterized protein (DUF2252 family)